MGGIVFDSGNLVETLSTIIGIKSGLALSLEDIIEHVEHENYKVLLRESAFRKIRLESTEFDDIYYSLLYRLGITSKLQAGFPFINKKYIDSQRAEYEKILKLYIEIIPNLLDQADIDGRKSIDPRFFIMECYKALGKLGVEMAIELLENVNAYIEASPSNNLRFHDFENPVNLNQLYVENSAKVELGEFLDQRLVNYLSHNSNKLSEIHWRKFEELVAEYFSKHGYRVELGPGRNDDGVDIRVWKANDNVIEVPFYIVQCKRQKNLIEKVVIKSLVADVNYENAEYGLIVTTSDLTRGAKNTITSRGYPIHSVNYEKLREWLLKMRKVGKGVVTY